jgi:cation:H+ antiporter
MMLEYILLAIGILFLVKGADLLVSGSSTLAKKFKIPTLIIGLTIVAFGTSLPELVVNVFAALNGTTEVAFGNIIGSNIANILLVLGILAIIRPIKVESSTVWKQIPFALLAAVVLIIFSNYLLLDSIHLETLTRVSGIIMLCFFAIFIYYVIDLARRSRSQVENKDFDIKVQRKGYVATIMILMGLVGLFFGGKWVVEGAVHIAQQFGMSEFLISATIIAIGTSLPELVTGLNATLKKREELAVGNSIGSNIFNIFWILGITALIAPIVIPQFINFDMIFLIFVTFILFVSMFLGTKHRLDRWQGVLFLLLYIGYISMIIIRG